MVVLKKTSVFVQISQYTIAGMFIRKHEFIQVCRKMLIIKALVMDRLMVRLKEYNNCSITNFAFKAYY